MGWFEEQIKERKQNDDELFAEALDRLELAITGKLEESDMAGDAASGDAYAESFEEEALAYGDLKSLIMNSVKPSMYIWIVIATLAFTALGLLVPKINYMLFSSVLDSGSIAMLAAVTAFAVLVGAVTALIEMVRNILSDRVNAEIDRTVETEVMKRLFSLPTEFFRAFSSGELTNKMTNIGELCNSIFTGVFITAITAVFAFIYLAQIANYASVLLIPALVIIIFSIVNIVCVTLAQIKVTERILDAAEELDGMEFGLISGIQKIKLSGSEKRAMAKWLRVFAKQMNLTYNLPFVLLYRKDIAAGISLLGEILLCYFAYSNHMSVAAFAAFNSAFAMLTAAFVTLGESTETIAEIKPTLKMAEPIMKSVPESYGEDKIKIELAGDIEFDDVSFRYSEKMANIFDGLSLRIEKGQYVAIVGKTGCGKSTLVRLMLGFEKPNKGSVRIDGQDIDSLDLRKLRRNVGTVLQNGKLFSGSIFENMTIASPSSTMEDAWNAAEIVGLADDIREMPMGMNTMISEGSGGISGGQKQRLMIARAIIHEPRILILDEATSALDNLTQRRITYALRKLDCTRIVIAHRLSTIKQCDRVIYLENGRIEEDGTYDALIARGGKFAELVERQRID